MCFVGFVTKLVIFVYAVKWVASKRSSSEPVFKFVCDSGNCKTKMVKGKKDVKVLDVKCTDPTLAPFLRTLSLKATELSKGCLQVNFNSTPLSPSESPLDVEKDIPNFQPTVTQFYTTPQKDKYIICIDLPGFKPSDVQATILDASREIHVKGTAGETFKRVVDVKVEVAEGLDLDTIVGGLECGVLKFEMGVDKKREGRRVVLGGGSGDEEWVKGV
ncbi:hypothetical protein HDV05_000345 [Chytridiales sp. JEL 0842]|nr:hypothetical protein HDV05_000345 [Chytridiales sp. JEL 0842]